MLLKLALLFAAGLLAGFFNIIAGGGSLLTIPALIFLGLPAGVANGTNRIAILLQNIVATSRFKQTGFFYWRAGLALTVPAVVGAILGSHVAVTISDALFEKILAGVMIVSLATVLTNKNRAVETAGRVRLKKRGALVAMFFMIGVYGGLIQAGVGFIIIFTLALSGSMSLVQINSLKIFVVLFYMIPSLIVFMVNGKVDWLYGLLLAAGNMLGGWLGVTFSIAGGDRWLRAVYGGIIVVMAAVLLLY